MDVGIENVELPVTMDFKNVCRFCGNLDKPNHPIKDLEIFSIDLIGLMNFLELHIEFNQYLSELVCNDCLKQLTSMAQFKVQCKSAESKMMAELGIPIKTEEIKLELLDPEENLTANGSENEYSESDSDYKPFSDSRKSQDCKMKSPATNKCEFCKQMFEDPKDLNDHDCDVKEMKCEICNENFEDRTSYRKHKRSHKKRSSDKKSTECLICHKTFPTFRGLSNHKLAHRRRDIEGFVPKKRPEAMCELCGMKFQTPSGLIKHNQTKHLATGQEFPCDECNKKFLNMIALKSHKANTHKIENATCQICGKTYKNKMLLRLHSRFHDESKRIFKCEYCPEKAGFFTKSDLKKHIRSHFGEKPYGCSNCEKRYASNRQLKNHRLSIHPELVTNPS